jgi:hypothetical protein
MSVGAELEFQRRSQRQVPIRSAPAAARNLP